MKFVVNARRIHAEAVEHLVHCIAHRAGAAHVVFDVFGSFVVLEICVVHHFMHKSRGVSHTCSIGSRVGTIQSQMELEVGEFLFDGEPLAMIGQQH